MAKTHLEPLPMVQYTKSLEGRIKLVTFLSWLNHECQPPISARERKNPSGGVFLFFAPEQRCCVSIAHSDTQVIHFATGNVYRCAMLNLRFKMTLSPQRSTCLSLSFLWEPGYSLWFFPSAKWYLPTIPDPFQDFSGIAGNL